MRCRGLKKLIIYTFQQTARRYLTPHSPGLRRRLTTNLSIGLMAHIASRTKCFEFVINSRQFCDCSQSDRLQADGDAVTNASDRVLITGRLGLV